MDVEGDRNDRDGASSTPKLPYLLHCGHSFCEECLARCAEAETSKSTSPLRVSPSPFATNAPPSGRSRLFGSLLLPSFSSSSSFSRPAFSLTPSPPSTTAPSAQRVRVSVACPVCRCRTPYDSARGPVGGLPKNYELIAAIRVIRSLVTAAAAAAASPPRRPPAVARGKRKRPSTTTTTSQRGDDDVDDDDDDEGRWHHPKGEKEEKRSDKKKKKTRRSVGGLPSTASVRSADSTTAAGTSGKKDHQPPAAAMSIDHAATSAATSASTITSSSRDGEEVVEVVEAETLPTAPPAHLFDDDDDQMVGDHNPSPAPADVAAEATSLSSPSSPPPSAPPLPFPSHLFHYTSSSSSSSPFYFSPPPSCSSPNVSSSSTLSATSSSSLSTSSTSTEGCVLFPSPGPPSWAFPAFLSLPLGGGGSSEVVGHSADARAEEASPAGDDARADAQAAATARAGRWVNSSPSCMRCEVAFGLFVRHRRCHYCGGLFCYRCCWQFCEMPVSFGYRRRQRTCSDCAQLLKTLPAPCPAGAGTAASCDSSPAMSTSSNAAAGSAALALCSPADGEREEWPSFDLKDKLATVYDISCKAVDAGVEALALAKGEASTEQSTFVPSDSTLLWGRCMGVMVALPLFVIGTSSVLMAAGGYHAWGFLARQRRKWREEKQIEEDEARITEARLRCGHPPQTSPPSIN